MTIINFIILNVSSASHLSDTTVFKVLNVSKDAKGFNWVDNLRPMFEFLIALVGAVTLFGKYLTQRRKEFEERIVANKREAYAAFLQDFTRTAVRVMYDMETTGVKEDKERMFARNQLLLYASDKVIQAYHEWIEYADGEEKDINAEVELFGNILLEIRNDIHGKTKVTAEQISNMNPFNRG